MRTKVGTEICRGLHLDVQLSINLANHFNSVTCGEMAVLVGVSLHKSSVFARSGDGCSRGNSRRIHGGHTRFNITSMLPPASIVAVSPRNWVTLPTMRTILCWKFERCGARTRGVWGWSMVSKVYIRERDKRVVGICRSRFRMLNLLWLC